VVASPFRWESSLPYPAPEVFAWHARPGAFERFNPPWRPVRVVKPPRSLHSGETVEIALPLCGPLAIPWKLTHTDYQENSRFCDEQVRGPFRTWRHVHSFIPQNDSSCIMRDEVFFTLPWGLTLARFFITRELKRLFSFRHMVLSTDLALHNRWKGLPRKRILIAGASGFIGSALTSFLSTAGHSVVRLVRRAPRGEDERRWDPDREALDPAVFDGVDVVINLAGENIFGRRWTPSFKRALVESRIKSASLLCRTIANLEKRPEVVISASGIGYYGDAGDGIVDEGSPAGRGFLADLSRSWEESARNSLRDTTRLVLLRLGVVLNPRGGALQRMHALFRLGLGGVLGSGKQYLSWISLQDLLGVFEHAIYTPTLSGPCNAVAPRAVTNRELTKTLGAILRRPTILPAPAPLLKAALGEAAQEMLLSSTRASPTRLTESDYSFLFPELADALRFECGH
jgi:uncharacterized protein